MDFTAFPLEPGRRLREGFRDDRAGLADLVTADRAMGEILPET